MEEVKNKTPRFRVQTHNCSHIDEPVRVRGNVDPSTSQGYLPDVWSRCAPHSLHLCCRSLQRHCSWRCYASKHNMTRTLHNTTLVTVMLLGKALQMKQYNQCECFERDAPRYMLENFQHRQIQLNRFCATTPQWRLAEASAGCMYVCRLYISAVSAWTLTTQGLLMKRRTKTYVNNSTTFLSR
jgi:hypothetical protein